LPQFLGYATMLTEIDQPRLPYHGDQVTDQFDLILCASRIRLKGAARRIR